jgi:hypothetical protein
VRDRNLVPDFYMWISSFASTNCWKDHFFFSLVCFGNFCWKSESCIAVWDYFWVFYCIPLVCVSSLESFLGSFIYNVFIVWFEVKCSETSSTDLLLRIALAILGILFFHMNITIDFFYFCGKRNWNLMEITSNYL